VVKRHLAERRAGRRTEADHFLLAADGSRVAVRIAATPLFEEDGTYSGSLKMVSDIRDQLAAEEENEALRGQLHQSQKLEGIGRLAGGVAHDFNNLLAVILNYAAFVEQELGDRLDLQADVREIQRAAERAAVLTHQLLVFSRRGHAQVERFDLSTVVAGMEELLRRTLGAQLELVVTTDPSAPAVATGRGQIEQIVLNLAVNARDALGDGGRLDILTEPIELDVSAARRQGDLAPGLYSRLTVTDNGSGMSPEVISRALEPFFTTKPVGEGSGLGLSTVYGIAEQAGGHVGIDSIEGAGTSVEVYLPAATGNVPSAPPPRPAPAGGDGRSVLLVEDEPAVRALTARLLRAQGYVVTAAASADAALEVADAPFDLLLTDVVMPGMSGKELAEAVHARHPGTGIVLMSGYTNDLAARDGGSPEHWTFLSKPFTAETLFPALQLAARGH
jgi:signal transduction histidine kinase